YVVGVLGMVIQFFFFSSRRRHTRFSRDWSSDVCSSDLGEQLHLQREGENVRINRRQIGAFGKAAELAIARQVLRIHLHPAAQTEVGQLPTRYLAPQRCTQKQAGQGRRRIEIEPVDGHWRTPWRMDGSSLTLRPMLALAVLPGLHAGQSISATRLFGGSTSLAD